MNRRGLKARGLGGLVSVALLLTFAGSPRAAPGAQNVPRNTLVVWDAKRDGDPKTYEIGGLRPTWSTRKVASDLRAPTLEIAGPGAAAYRLALEPGPSNPSASFGVGLIDPQGGPDQILISTYTGGAHCCDQLDLLQTNGGAWTRTNVGSWNGGPLTKFPTDVDGDTIPDLVMTDDRFLYVFASYAGSSAPPQIMNVLGGKVVDVSRNPRYRVLFQADMETAKGGCVEHNNGPCAAFIADSLRLGVFDWAWPIMMENFDRTSTWLYNRCAVAVRDSGCPAGRELKPVNFPQSLFWFLTDNGYAGPAYPLSPIAEKDMPGFDCARAMTPILQLICKTPALARRDRALTAAYSLAMRAAPDKDALRESERAWIRARDAAPATADVLARIYDERLQTLGALAGSH